MDSARDQRVDPGVGGHPRGREQLSDRCRERCLPVALQRVLGSRATRVRLLAARAGRALRRL
jgi:hypothetical protein